jgi:DNA modification methylase
MLDRCYIGDCRDVMRDLIARGTKVQTVVTSPPYWGLRDYGVPGQLGLERSPLRYVARMRSVFRLVRELLADDGTLWLNLGDSYASPRACGGIGASSTINGQRTQEEFRKASRAMKSRIKPPAVGGPNRREQRGLKEKDLIGMPWRVAFALQADGWYLRRDIVWHKPNPMPESVEDRPTTAHEYLFLMTKSPRYYYDAEAIRERASEGTHERRAKYPSGKKPVAGWATGSGSHAAVDHARSKRGERKLADAGYGVKNNDSFDEALAVMPEWRNKRSVWTVPTQPFPDAHFATFPEKLIEPCILAGSRPGDVVFDPFMGAGTVAAVATRLGRRWIGAELNPQYVELQKPRAAQQAMPL